MIRRMSISDAGWAAEQHATLMQHSVFARFGTGFLECFYRCFARSDHGLAFVDEDEGRVCAVIASTSDRPAFLRDLLKRDGLRLALYALRGVFRRGCLQLVAQIPAYLRRVDTAGDPAEMVFITVDAQHRHGGIARSLIEATLAEYGRRGVRSVTVSIESDNLSIKRVLEDMGFAVTQTFVFAGKRNDLLRKLLPGPTV